MVTKSINKSPNNILRSSAQASTEYLLLIGVALIVIIVVSYLALQPKEDIANTKAVQSLDIMADTANRVAVLGPGNTLKIDVEIPSSISGISYDSGEINFNLETSAGSSDLHKPLSVNLSGYDFSDGSLALGAPRTLVFESMGSGVCVYPPEKRSEYCYCFNTSRPAIFFTKMEDPEGLLAEQPIMCTVETMESGKTDAKTVVCDDFFIRYGRTITSLHSKCSAARGYVVYRIYDKNDELIFEKKASTRDSSGYYNLTGMRYEVQNSGDFTISATCYDECYGVASTSLKNALIETETVSFIVPYGIVCPYIYDADGNKYYSSKANQRCRDEFADLPNVNFTDVITHRPIINATGPNNYPFSRVVPDACIIIRSGYDCIDGECIGVNVSLFHNYMP